MIGSLSNEEFLQKVLAFHGHAAPGVLIGGFIVEAARAHMKEGCLFDVISETRQCLPDAIQMLTPCTVGNGWLQVQDLSLYALVMYDKYSGEGCRAWLDPEKLKRFPMTYEWFFKLKAKKEQDGDALRREIMDHGAEMISTRPIRMHAEALGHKSKGAILTCPVCGDAYPAKFGDKCPLCQSGRSYDFVPEPEGWSA